MQTFLLDDLVRDRIEHLLIHLLAGSLPQA